MNIVQAISEMQNGQKVRRSTWPEGVYIRLVNFYADPAYSVVEKEPIDGTLMPEIYMNMANGSFITWQVTQECLFGTDFEVFS